VWDKKVTMSGVPLLGIRRHRNKLWRLWQLSRVVWQERPDLIHSWSDHTSLYLHWLLYPRTPRIVAVRNNPTVDQHTAQRRSKVPNAVIYEAAECVVSNSLAALDCARISGVRMRRAEVVSNIVLSRGRSEPGNFVAVPRIVAARLLIPLKSYDTLLYALGQLASEGQPFELLIAGEGPERPRLEGIAARLGIARQVRFLGGVDDIPALFATAHLMVHPSKSEGLSNTILEAMAEGLPVVASDVDGAAELITDRKTGLLVPPNQPEALAAKIRLLLSDPSLRAELGRSGLDLVHERCSVGSITARYESIYQSVIEGALIKRRTNRGSLPLAK
jgi:glycosyltransferase involved in cell wall biosynthesis